MRPSGDVVGNEGAAIANRLRRADGRVFCGLKFELCVYARSRLGDAKRGVVRHDLLGLALFGLAPFLFRL